MLYLASPYSDDNPELQDARFTAAETACALLLMQNIAVYSPIVHWHEISKKFPQLTYDHFMNCDLTILTRAAGIVVLQIEGWLTSRGVQLEIDHALKHDIPICYLNPRTGAITDEPTK